MSQSNRKKGTIKELIENFVAAKINQYLGKYLLNIKKEDIQSSFGTNSAITLNNLQLRKDAFSDLRLPIEVDSSSIVKELRCELRMIPLQVNIYMKGVRAIVLPNTNSWTPEQWKEYKTKYLAEWEENQKHLFDNLNLKSYKKSKINTVANNINVIIEDIIIYYQDIQALGSPCVIRFRLEELKLVTTDFEFQKEKPSSSEDTTYRKILLKDLSLAIYSEYSDPYVDIHLEDIRFSERMYVIRPCSITVYHTMHHKVRENEPLHKVKVFIQNMVISINELQKQFLTSLNLIMKNQTQYKEYEENRPVGGIEGNEQQWWSYLIKTCRQDLDLNIIGLIKNRQNMNRYIDYYKCCQGIMRAPWLDYKNKDKKRALEEIENMYALDKLIWYRTLALYQLRIEAMAYVKARGNVKGKTHLGDLWDYYLNDFESLLGDPYKTVAEEHEIELTAEEKEELNHLLKIDDLKIVDSYLNGTSSSRNDKMVKLIVEISQLTIFIQEAQTGNLAIRTISKYECACGRCNDLDASPKKFSMNISNEENKQERLNQARDVVYSIIMVNQEGKSYDPKLVKEHTLLVIEAGVEGELMIYRDMHIESIKNIIIKDPEIWDPLTLHETKEIEAFKKKYGFSTCESLLDMILFGRPEEFTLTNSLRFFMQEAGLVSEFEFIIHWPSNFDKLSHFCTCKKPFFGMNDLKKHFLDPKSLFCLHLSKDQLEKWTHADNLRGLYESTKEFMNTQVMPRFMRNCVRWIVCNSTLIKRSNGEKNVQIQIRLKGKSSPLEVQFVNRQKRKNEENKFDEIFKENKLIINSDLVGVTMSTETVHSLIKWMMRSHETFMYKKSFINTLTSFSPKMQYAKNIINNMKKSGKQLLYIIKDKQRNMQNVIVEINVEKLMIKVVETIFHMKKGKGIISNIEINRLVVENNKSYEKKSDKRRNSAEMGEIQGEFAGTLRFYLKSDIKAKSVAVYTQGKPVLEINDLSYIDRNCIMEAHPHLIERISELNVQTMNIFIRKELLSILGLISSLDLTPLRHFSKENRDIKSLQKHIYTFDKKALTEELIKYQENHYHYKKPKDCIHCILAYKKLKSTLNFSIGDPDVPNSGLNLCFFSFHAKDKSISVSCPLIIGTSQERVFMSDLNIFAAEFTKDNNIIVTIARENLHKEFDANECSPIFPTITHTANHTPYLAGSINKTPIPLRLLMSTTRRTNTKIFDFNIWKSREKVYERYSVNLFRNTNENTLPKLLKYEPNKDSYIQTDRMRLNIQEIRFIINDETDYVLVNSVLFSIFAFYQAYLKYFQSIKINQLRKINDMKSEIMINLIKFKCRCPNRNYVINVNNMKIVAYPSVFVPEIHKPEKRIENTSVLYIQSVDLLIGKTLNCKINHLSIFTQDSSNQVKYFDLIFGKKEIPSDIKTSVLTNIRITSINMSNRTNATTILRLPLASNDEEAIEENAIGINISMKVVKENDKIVRNMSIESRKLIICTHAEIIVKIINSCNLIIFPLKTNKLFKMLSFSDKLIFFNMKHLVIEPYNIEFSLLGIAIDLILQDAFITKIYLENFKINNKKNKEKFKGKNKILRILSPYNIHPDIVEPSNQELKMKTKISYNVKTKTILIKINNAKLIYLTKFIEECLEFSKCIQSELPKEKSDSSSSTFMHLIFINSEIIIPKSTESNEAMVLKFKEAEIMTGDQKISQWSPPKRIKIVKVEKEVSIESADANMEVKCNTVTVSLKVLDIIFAEQHIGSASKASLIAYIPVSPEEQAFILKQKIHIELYETKMNLSLGKMKTIEDLINCNVDEPLEGKEKKITSKNTKFKVNISTGSAHISRWVTKPFMRQSKIYNLKINDDFIS